jgi:hypothetical protein
MMRTILLILSLCLISSVSFADRTIVTPSGYTMPTGYDAETMETVNGQPRSIEYINAGNSNIQFETAFIARPGVDRFSESIQALVLPETFVTPALSIGVKDVSNSAGAFSADGFYGRAYYLAVTKSLGNLLTEPGSHGPIITGGLGAGSYHGFFGGVNDVLPMNLLAAAEFDGRSLNYRLSYQTSSTSRLSLLRIGGSNWVGFDFHSPVSL